jgi:HD-like signal output (HDOD) protein
MENMNEMILRLRKRVKDLMALDYMTPESAGTYEQTILQFWQEVDRQRMVCLQQAETLRRQASAAEAQAGAFTAIGSILFNVVNGFVEAGQKKAQEEIERATLRQQELDDTSKKVRQRGRPGKG